MLYTYVCIDVIVCIPSFLCKVEALLLKMIQYFMTFAKLILKMKNNSFTLEFGKIIMIDICYSFEYPISFEYPFNVFINFPF